MANLAYRGFTDDRLIHYVWQGEFLDFWPECWNYPVRYNEYTVEKSRVPVNCMICMMCVDAR